MATLNPPAARTIDLQVLGRLRVGEGISRVELARQLSISPSTIGTHVDRLVGTGLLRERKSETSSAGRPPTILELNPEAGQFIGVDLDSREIFGVSVDFAQRLLRDRTEVIAARESAQDVIERIGRVIEDVRDQSRQLLGIGLAVPGTVDSASGRAIQYRFIRGWRDLALADQVSAMFDVPVCLENNVRAMAHAERSFGLAKTTDDFVCLGIRSGIGSSIFLGGEIHRGASGMAGEIGTWVCEHDCDSASKKSSVRTLEQTASLLAIVEQLTVAIREGQQSNLRLTRGRVTIEGLLEAMDSGDALVQSTLRHAACQVGNVVAKISLLVDPEAIIISGPLAGASEAFMKPLRETVHRCLANHQSKTPIISASQLGPLGGALGAAALAVHSWRPTQAPG